MKRKDPRPAKSKQSTDRLAVLSVILAIVGVVAAILVIPEVRRWLNLPDEATEVAIKHSKEQDRLIHEMREERRLLKEQNDELKRHLDQQRVDMQNFFRDVTKNVLVPQQKLLADLAAARTSAEAAAEQRTGFAATQARFLQLSARKSDLDLRMQYVNQARMSLANTTGQLYTEAANLPASSQDIQQKINELRKLDAALAAQQQTSLTHSKAAEKELAEIRKIVGRNVDSSFRTFG